MTVDQLRRECESILKKYGDIPVFFGEQGHEQELFLEDFFIQDGKLYIAKDEGA